MLYYHIILTSAVLGSVFSHDYGWGACPHIDSEANLSIDKFLGTWYVTEQFDTGSSCYSYNYTRSSPTQLKVTKGRRFDILTEAGIDHSNSYTGTLDIPSAEDQGRMRIKWPANILGKADYVVFATDYNNYAAILSCQQLTRFAHRLNAAILSTTPTLEEIYVTKIKNRLLSAGVDITNFDKIDHSNCAPPSDSTLRLHVDENTLKNVVNNVVNVTSDLGRRIASGTRGLIDEGRRRFGEQTEPNSDVEIIN